MSSHPLEEADVLDLITRGRRTGQPHRVELWFVYRDGAIYLMAHARSHGQGTDWYQNLSVDPQVIVEAERGRWEGVAELLSPEWLPTVTDWFREKYGAATVRHWYEDTPRLPVRVWLKP
ncbi:MAG TPA: nitroreductase/quinone reductase family protein [Thermoflexus sp.]|nr:nitroreductase/quinone reductase family protein [Thermoflexus sp.]